MKASRVCLFVACWIGTGAIAYAQTTRTWNVASGTWGTTTSWDGGTAASATDPAFFSGAGAGTGAVTVLLEANKTVLGMTFDTGTTTLRGDTAARILTLGTSGITMNSTAGPVTLGVTGSAVNLQLSGSQTWTNNSGNTFTTIGTVTTAGSSGPVLLTLSGTSTALSSFNAAISGAAGREISITKTGLGLWNLSGNNSYAGTTSVEQGSLRIGNVNGLGSGTGGTVVKDGGNLQINTTGTFTENISIAGAGVPGGSGVTYGALSATINPGQAVTFSGSISLTANATISHFGGQAGNSSASSVTFSNGISGTGDLTLRSGAANNGRATFMLNGQSTYTGSTIFSTGNISGTFTVQSGTNNALPTTTVLNMAASAASGVSVGTVVNYRLGGFDQTLAGLTGGTAGGSGATAYSNIVTGGSSTLSTLTLNVASGTSYTFAGTLGGAGTDENNLALVKSGAGTQTLTGNNTYTGLTTISGGTLALSAAGALATTGTVAVTNSGAAFDISSANSGRTLGMLTGAASSVVSLGANSLTVGDASSGTFAGVIGGTGGLTKSGAGTLALTGANTYTGLTTISTGTLAFDRVAALNSSSGISVAAGSVLEYTGTAGTLSRNVTVSSSGTGTIRNSGGQKLTLSGTLTKDGRVLRLTGGQFDVTGTIVGASQNSDLLVDGTSTVTLLAANTYNGPTFVNQSSSLIVGINNAIPSNSLVTLGDATTTGTLSLGSFSNAIGGLAFGAGGGTLRLAATSTSAAPLTASTGTMTLTNGTLDLAGSGSTAGLYRVLSGGSVSGQFTSVTGTIAAYQVIYSSTSVDYQQRAVLGAVSVTNPATAIITGGSAAFTYSVTNTALSGGAALPVTGTGLSNVVGTSSGTAAAGSSTGSLSGLIFTGTGVGAGQQGTFTVNAPTAYGSTSATGTVSVDVYGHASGSITGGTIRVADSIVGYSGALAGLTSATVSNASGYRVDLKTLGTTSTGGVTINNVNGVTQNTSATISASVVTGSTTGANAVNQQFVLTYADASSLAGASNNLGSGTVTVQGNVYDHASGSAAGTTIALADSIVGYTGSLSGLTSATISNAAGYRVNLMTTGGTSAGFVNINNVSGIASGSSALISAAASLNGAQTVGTNALGQVFNLTYADNSALAGASNNLGSQSITVTGKVLDHATSSLASGSTAVLSTVLTLGTWDYAQKAWTSGSSSAGFSIYNLASQYGASLTADLSLLSVSGTGNGFSTNLGSYADIGGGSSGQYWVTVNPTNFLTSGTQSWIFTIGMSDKTGMAGATPTNTLTVTANVIVVPEPGALALGGLGIGLAGWMARKRRLKNRFISAG